MRGAGFEPANPLREQLSNLTEKLLFPTLRLPDLTTFLPAHMLFLRDWRIYLKVTGK